MTMTVNPRWGDKEKTVIHTDDGMSIPAIAGNKDYDILVADDVSIAGYVEPEKSWVEIRGERDQRLLKTDWMAVSDRTMTDAQTAYRQALRDIPQDFSDASSVVWPTVVE